MAKFLIKRVQARPGMIPGIWFHVFACNSLVKDVCVFTSTPSCNQSPKAVGTPEHTPQHKSSRTQLLPRPLSSSPLNIRRDLWQGGQGQRPDWLPRPPAHVRRRGGNLGREKKSEKDAEGCCVRSLCQRVCAKTKTVETLEGETAEMKTNSRQNRVYAEQNKTPWLENWIPLGEGKEQDADNEI